MPEEIDDFGQIIQPAGVPLTPVHDPDDSDGSQWSTHHTLGQDHLQAAHGDHLTVSHPDWLSTIAGLSLSGVPGPAGPQGPIGVQGPIGPTGPAGTGSTPTIASLAKYGMLL